MGNGHGEHRQETGHKPGESSARRNRVRSVTLAPEIWEKFDAARERLGLKPGAAFEQMVEAWLASDYMEGGRSEPSRTCQQCGDLFDGTARAQFCPKCRELRKKEQILARYERSKRTDRTRIDWSGVDWSRPIREIAAEKGVIYVTAYAARKRLCGGRDIPKAQGKWDTVDWNKGNAEIARDMGVSRQRVFEARKRYAPPKPQQAAPLPDEERFRLLGAPYLAPEVRPGDWLDDAERGPIQVGGYTETARIPWPRTKKRGKASLILCGDLIRAVQTESAQAIMHWWNVSNTIVARWRKLLGIGQAGSEGSLRLYQLYKPQKLTEDISARAREKARSPESRAKISAAKTGKPMPPRSQELLEKYRVSLLHQWESGARNRTPVWTPEADAQLLALRAQGLTAKQIAQEMGKTRYSVKARFQTLRGRR